MQRIILTTGGTGGHIFPALAVAGELQRQGCEVLFIGSQYGPEASMAAKAGVEFRGLPVHGVLRRGIAAIGAAVGLFTAIFPARQILKHFKPDVVAGFGAYASVAPLLAARSLGIPYVLHEQNILPGLSNKILGKMATKICLSLPLEHPVFPAERCVLTGNPVRQTIATIASGKPHHAESKHLLVTGGSQGARAVNSVVLAILPRLFNAGVEIRHQCGKLDFDRVRAGYLAHGYDTSHVSAFIDDMAEAYSWADLVLCRAGATSVAELAVAGKASVLIPFPYATHDHQTHNAAAIVAAGAGCMLPENEISKTDVAGLVLNLLEDRKRLDAMSAASLQLAKPNAAKDVARVLLNIAENRHQ